MTVSSWRPQRDFEPGTSHRGKYNCSERAVTIRRNPDGLKSGVLPDDVNVPSQYHSRSAPVRNSRAVSAASTTGLFIARSKTSAFIPFEPTLGFSVSSLMARLIQCLKPGRNLLYRDFRWQRLNHTISVVITPVAFCPHRQQ